MWVLPSRLRRELCPASPVSEDLTKGSAKLSQEPSLYYTSNGKPTQRPVSWPGWRSRPWSLLLFGSATLPKSTAKSGVERWIQSLRGGHALPSPSQVSGRGTVTHDGCGRRSGVFYSRLEQHGFWVRTLKGSVQSTLVGSTATYSGTWPKWGSMYNGEVFALQMWEPPTGANASSCLPDGEVWPTPDAGVQMRDNRSASPGATIRPALAKKVQTWPTPTSTEQDHAGPREDRRRSNTLTKHAENWRTPSANMDHQDRGTLEGSMRHMERGHMVGLADQVKVNWRTPSASDGEGGIFDTERAQREGLNPKLKLRDQAGNWSTPKVQNANSPGEHGRGGKDLQTMATQWSTPDTMSEAPNQGFHRKNGPRPIGDAAKGMWSTPQASEKSQANSQNAHVSLSKQVQFTNEDSKIWPTPRTSPGKTYLPQSDGRTGLSLEGKAIRWQTPRAIYGEHPGSRDMEHLTGQAIAQSEKELWQTPDASPLKTDFSPQKEIKGQLSLSAQTTQWATPQSRDWRDGRASQTTLSKNTRPLNEMVLYQNGPLGPKKMSHGHGSSRTGRDSPQLSLNPLFVEWLMGFKPLWSSPYGLIASGHWAMQSYQPKQLGPSKPSGKGSKRKKVTE